MAGTRPARRRSAPKRSALCSAGLVLSMSAEMSAAVISSRSRSFPEKVRYASEWLNDRLAVHGDLNTATRDPSSYLDNGEYAKAQEDFMWRNAELAVEAVEKVNRSGEVSQELFLRDVLPFRHFDEPVDKWRPFFYERLGPLADRETSLRGVAEAVLPAAFGGALGKKVEFKGNNTPQVMAPISETLAKGYASCTGVSIFAADALRSVGVPARVVGTPEWNVPTGGNHNWVEVWWGGAWHFIDGAPVTDTVEWDKTWFLENTREAVAGTKHGIYTPVVDTDEADAKYLITWREPPFQMQAKDRTAFYKGRGVNPEVNY
mmetsp:Transcript_29053/g.67584  ORF Transcript_29053/g.67584 Transcript_29053/m.67584 type:complete len:318 (+) Transcript_29053:63-1016(+)